jgi:hypothetical protein
VKPWAKVHYQTPHSLANKRPPTKKEATPKSKRLRENTSDKKGGNSKTQGAKKKRPLTKKEETLKHKGLRKKISDEKRGNPKTQGAKKKDIR